MILGIDPTTIGAIAGAIVLVIGAIGANVVLVVNAINKRAEQASRERQGIAQGIGTQIERSSGVQPPPALQPPPANPP